MNDNREPAALALARLALYQASDFHALVAFVTLKGNLEYLWCIVVRAAQTDAQAVKWAWEYIKHDKQFTGMYRHDELVKLVSWLKSQTHAQICAL